ncbi:hypothetical protein C0995_012349, partial [Termitomyces sp. Mi166
FIESHDEQSTSALDIPQSKPDMDTPTIDSIVRQSTSHPDQTDDNDEHVHLPGPVDNDNDQQTRIRNEGDHIPQVTATPQLTEPAPQQQQPRRSTRIRTPTKKTTQDQQIET